MRCNMCGCDVGSDFTQVGATRLCGNCNGHKNDNVNPNHYKAGGLETIDILEAKLSPQEYEGFLRGNILKYVTRYSLKNGVEDLKKAKWYLDKLIEVKSK